VFGTITVSGTASARAGISSVSVAVDSGSFQPATLTNGGTSWAYSLNTNNVTNGAHTLTASAVDTHGRVAASGVSVNVDNTPPTITISTPKTGALISGSVSVAGTAASQAGIAGVQVRVDSYAWTPASGTTAWNASIASSNYADGAHTISAMATDSVGHLNIATESVTFSNSPPTVSITSPQPGATVSATIAVSGTAASLAGIASVQLQVDSNGWVTAAGTTSWTLSINTTAYSNGAHTISAMATDALGRSSTASISVTVSNLIQTHQSPWYLIDSTGNVSTVNETMTWDGANNVNSKLPSGTVTFRVNSTTQPNDSNASDTCSQDAGTGYWSCAHQIQSADLQFQSVLGWSLHYAFQLQVEYPPADTFTISYSGDSSFASSSAPAVNT
jgi:hypothetical protein